MHIHLNNGKEMPALGLGVYRMAEKEEAVHSILWALEAGYRHIDTASYYGNEEAVGEAIRQSGLPRNEIFVTTKLWNDDQRLGNVEDALQMSLSKLGLNYVDLYLVHWPVKDFYLQTWEKMENIYEKQYAGAIGVSNFQVHHLENLKQNGKIVPAVNQIECHPYLAQKEVRAYCQDANIAVTCWSPLGALKNNLLEESTIVSIAKTHGRTPAQIILRWDIENGLSTIPKSSNKQRIEENMDVFDFQLSPSDKSAIDALDCGGRVGPDPDNFDF